SGGSSVACPRLTCFYLLSNPYSPNGSEIDTKDDIRDSQKAFCTLSFRGLGKAAMPDPGVVEINQTYRQKKNACRYVARQGPATEPSKRCSDLEQPTYTKNDRYYAVMLKSANGNEVLQVYEEHQT
ncbi:MAG: hypothetical protein K2X93_03950, partial [Candidatus Obscuribacterales bacterium]|nr:hypothetical protein [Candidatus Obscuribacterales bacterium]